MKRIMKHAVVLLVILLSSVCLSAKQPPFSVHHEGTRQKWPQQKADLLFNEVRAAIEAEVFGDIPRLRVRLEGAKIEFRPQDAYGWDCSKNLIWMPKWDERWFAIAFGKCALLETGHTLSDEKFDRAIHRALVATNALYFEDKRI